jgi:hypothetical protein
MGDLAADGIDKARLPSSPPGTCQLNRLIYQGKYRYLRAIDQFIDRYPDQVQ